MKDSTRRLALGVLALGAAVGVGFISGYMVSPGSPASKHQPAANAPATALNSTNNGKEAGQTNKETQSLSENRIASSEAYSSNKPSLMALTLSDSSDSVISRYGNPVREYAMNDDTGNINVFEYAGFSVGFDNKRKVLYVEINGISIDPGLNGLHLGQSKDAAIQALGKPDTNTGYVVAYKTKSTVLKLDVDPLSNTVQSIKLFARAAG
jgi:hypothetical protein